MHRAILGLGPWTLGEPEADHIDGDGLNNRRANLRVVTHSGNAQNRDNHRLKPKVCLTCGEEFQPARSKIRYCSNRCSNLRPEASVIDRNRSPEQRAKVSAALKGRPKSPEHRDALRAAAHRARIVGLL